MRLSVWPAATRSFSDIVNTVVALQDQGWDCAYIEDHFMPNGSDDSLHGTPLLECFTTLAALGTSTTSIRLGSLVAGNTYRHPAVLANMAASISNISGGRFTLGLGAGWQQNEHEAYGIELGTVTQRLDRLEEAAGIITSLLRVDRTTIDGDYYKVVDAPCEPKPVDRMPLIIAGKGERRTMRIAARYADVWNGWCTPDELIQKSAVLDQRCMEIGRDPAAIERSTQAFVAFGPEQVEQSMSGPLSSRPWLRGSDDEITHQLGQFAAAGADELIIPDWNLGASTEVIDTLGRLYEIADEVLTAR